MLSVQWMYLIFCIHKNGVQSEVSLSLHSIPLDSLFTWSLHHFCISHAKKYPYPKLNHLFVHQSFETPCQTSTQGTLVCTAEYKGRGLHSVFLPRCPGTSLAFTRNTLSECPRHVGGGVSNDWCIIIRKYF